MQLTGVYFKTCMKGQQTALSWLGRDPSRAPKRCYGRSGERTRSAELPFVTTRLQAWAAPEPNYTIYYDFGRAADRVKATGDEGIDRTLPSRPAPSDPTISRAPRA